MTSKVVGSIPALWGHMQKQTRVTAELRRTDEALCTVFSSLPLEQIRSCCEVCS